MELLSYVIPFLFVLTIVVFFHELGHFSVARWFGVRVETFSIGFGGKIFGWVDSKGTVWKIGWIPLGGYVKFFGDESVASTPDREKLGEISANTSSPLQTAGADSHLPSEGSQVLSASEQEECFHFKPLYQRALIVAAGPIANFVLAVIIFAFLFSVIGQRMIPPRIDAIIDDSPALAAGFQVGDVIEEIDGRKINNFSQAHEIISISANDTLSFLVRRGSDELLISVVPEQVSITDQFGNVHKVGQIGIERVLPPVVDELGPDGPAERAGVEPGDIVRKINGREINSFLAMQQIVQKSAGVPLQFTIERDGRLMELEVTPGPVTITDRDGKEAEVGRIGIQGHDNITDYEVVRVGVFSALWMGVERTWFIIERTFDFLGGLFMGQEDASQLSGPLGIAKVSGEVAHGGLVPLISLAAILSVSIGLLNLFPIPMLDGGHLLYYGYEAVAGRPLGERAQEFGFRVGLALVISLMLFATWNDLVKFRIFG